MLNLTNRISWFALVLVIINIKNNNASGAEGLENYSVYYGVCLQAKANNLKIVSNCLEQLSSIGSGIQRRDRWALKLLDASGAPETKLHWGNRFWLGSRRQCHAAAELRQIPVSPSARTFTETNQTISPFPVEYYAIYFHHNSTMQSAINSDINEFIINMRLCLPSSCTEQEVYSLVQEYFNTNKLIIQRLYNMECKMDSVKKMTNDYSWMKERRFKVFTCSIGSLVLLSIFATLYDIGRSADSEHHGHEPSNNEADANKKAESPNFFYEKLIQCFSLYKNARTLFDTNVRKGTENFKPIFGFRFFLSSWIIMYHSVLYTGDATHNVVSGLIATEDGLTMPMYCAAMFIVDSFITLSGFLMGYFFLDTERKRIESKVPERSMMKKLFLIVYEIFSRFLRLTPTYMVALGFTEFLTKWRHRETFSWIAERHDVNCPKYWWSNLLYIGNMFPRLELCMGWSWYLNVDMQIFIICFAVIVFASSNVRTMVSIFTFLLLVSNLFTSYVGYTGGYKLFLDNHRKFFEIIYQAPWVRLGPYIVGIFSGHLLRNWNGELKITKKWITLGWLLCLSIFGVLTLGFNDKDISLINSALYVGWSKTFWSLATAWCLVACISNNGGLLGRLLSLRLWIPLSRVTYSAYLIHPTIIMLFSSFKESAWELSSLMSIIDGLGFVVVSFACSIVFSLLFESPLVGVSKIILEGGKKSANKPTNTNDDHCDAKDKKS